MGAIAALARRLAILDAVSATIAGIAIFVIMIVVVVDVALRYLFNSPLAWAFDLISLYLMGATFYFALSHTLRHDHHVAVDILANRFTPRVRDFWRLVAWALTTVLFVLIFKLALAGATSRFASGDVVAGAIPWPTWIPYAIACIGAALIIVRLALGVLIFAGALLTGDRSHVDAAIQPTRIDETKV